MAKPPASLFVVLASSGEYEMHTTWPVAICDTEAAAIALQANAQAVADQLVNDAQGSWLLLSDFADGLNPFDPSMSFVLGDPIHYYHGAIPFWPELHGAGLPGALPKLEEALAHASAEFQARASAPDPDLQG